MRMPRNTEKPMAEFPERPQAGNNLLGGERSKDRGRFYFLVPPLRLGQTSGLGAAQPIQKGVERKLFYISMK